MKHVVYFAAALKDIQGFPAKAKQRIVTALATVSAGLNLSPNDFKYMSTVGMGVYELRIKTDQQYRVFYVAKFEEAVYVLHAFVKKTQQTSDGDIALGATRYKSLVKERKEKGYE
jgi:phage-related protein